MATHNDLGTLGEQLAIAFLEKNNYVILHKNWRYLKAEIDIIAQKNNTLVIVEVKTRATDFFGNPEDFISNTKKRLLIKAADAYIQQQNINLDVRFDVIAILKNKQQTKIDHIKNAFLSFE